MKKLLFLLGVLVIAIVVVFLFNKKDERTFLTIDINPSIGLYLEEDIVTEVVYLNNEAYIALDDKDLVNKNIDDVLDEILDVSIEMGYLEELLPENLINITTYIEEETENEELNLKIRNKIKEKLQQKNIQALVVKNGLNEEIKEKADEYEIPYGKMLLIERAMVVNTELTIEEALTMSVKDIQLEIKEKSKELKEEVKANIKNILEEKERIKDATKIAIENRKSEILDSYSEKDVEKLKDSEKQELMEQYKENIKNQNEYTKTQLEEDNEIYKEIIKNRVYNR